MASYHLRVKDDTRQSGSKVSAKRHADYILREEGQAHADYINREGAQSDRNDCVFKGSQNGRKVRLKNFSARRPVMRIRETAGTKKSNCLCQTN